MFFFMYLKMKILYLYNTKIIYGIMMFPFARAYQIRLKTYIIVKKYTSKK